MKTVGIPYSAQMILAKLAGTKTQTRRVIMPQPLTAMEALGNNPRRGVKGDVQYWQEAFDFIGLTDAGKVIMRYKAGHQGTTTFKVLKTREEFVMVSKWKPPAEGKARGMPPMYMLPSMSRGRDKVIEVRLQRVQDITEDDAIAEGLDVGNTKTRYSWSGDQGKTWWGSPITAYKALWNSINSARGFGWDANPWVFAYTTETINP